MENSRSWTKRRSLGGAGQLLGQKTTGSQEVSHIGVHSSGGVSEDSRAGWRLVALLGFVCLFGVFPVRGDKQPRGGSTASLAPGWVPKGLHLTVRVIYTQSSRLRDFPKTSGFGRPGEHAFSLRD